MTQSKKLIPFILTAFLAALPAFWPNQTAAKDAEPFLELPPGWNFGEVAGVELTPEGHFIVFHRGQHQLLEFDSAGKFVGELAPGLFETPHGLRIDEEGFIWVTDTGTHLVLKLDREGRVQMVLGKKGSTGPGWFDRDYNLPLFTAPNDVALDKEGNIYVTDGGNQRIIKFAANGVMVGEWGDAGSGPGQFNLPHSIVIDSGQRVYVSDRENRRIQIFDTEGNFLEAWDEVGYPYVLFLDQDQTIWLTDARAEEVKHLDSQGRVTVSFGTSGKAAGEFGFVHGLAVGPDGTVYTGEVLNWRVQRFPK